MDSLDGRSDVFETAPKLVKGFRRVGVRNFAHPIRFNTAYCATGHTRDWQEWRFKSC